MNKPGATGIRRIVRATGFSAKGIRQAWTHEAAFRQEVVLAVLMTPLAMWLGGNPLERGLLIACLLLVLVVELLNSAIEATVDRFGGEQHELSGRAKDMGSAAVFFSLAIVVVVWGAVAWQRFLT